MKRRNFLDAIASTLAVVPFLGAKKTEAAPAEPPPVDPQNFSSEPIEYTQSVVYDPKTGVITYISMDGTVTNIDARDF